MFSVCTCSRQLRQLQLPYCWAHRVQFLWAPGKCQSCGEEQPHCCQGWKCHQRIRTHFSHRRVCADADHPSAHPKVSCKQSCPSLCSSLLGAYLTLQLAEFGIKTCALTSHHRHGRAAHELCSRGKQSCAGEGLGFPRHWQQVLHLQA